MKDSPPSQEEEMDNLFYKQRENVSGSPALVLVGDFNLPDICWELNTAEKRQSRKLLKRMDDNFLLQLVSETTRGVIDGGASDGPPDLVRVTEWDRRHNSENVAPSREHI
ncbi:hypothetical protein HGM15179_012174 [Zosterops borbonicus]|uniref:Endonuclease/exonuclease/phosphatase domain-containing protein n=1 Tax=Zosterops borbonicus TaxID=364589 RepID=A0A8K1GB83_9PASS|nr:hypothetical protein HGM15179_012174 [Zosterops borbonicus]